MKIINIINNEIKNFILEWNDNKNSFDYTKNEIKSIGDYKYANGNIALAIMNDGKKIFVDKNGNPSIENIDPDKDHLDGTEYMVYARMDDDKAVKSGLDFYGYDEND